MIVADASVIVDALRGRPAARDALLEQSLFAPHSVDLEVLNALRWLTLVGELPVTAASRCLVGLRHLGVIRYPTHGLTDRIWELRDHCTYDAAYVAVAEALECPLVTADAKLATAPGLNCDVVLVAG